MIIVWYRYDLRVADHPALWHAHHSGQPVLPVYVWDEALGQPWLDQPRMGPHRRRHIECCIAALSHSLEQLGSRLLVMRGDPVALLTDLAVRFGATAIHCHEEPAPDEQLTQQRLRLALQPHGIALKVYDGSSLYQVDDLPFRPHEVPDLFTQFRQRVEHTTLVRTPLPAPDYLKPLSEAVQELLPDNLEFQISNFKPEEVGEYAAQAHLHHYLWETDRLNTYKDTRNDLLGDSFSTRLSPWLAQGCLSPRQVYAHLRRYEQEKVKNESTYWLFFELLWREYFRAVASKFGPLLFRDSGIMNVQIPWEEQPDHLAAWQQGRTGYPLVDAAMRQLMLEGWISNRARQVVASFLTKNLHLDWRLGAVWMEHWLMDYDPCSHYGNWNYAAGVGNDGRGYRFFHITVQGQEYDPNGEYVRKYVPELADVPTRYIHEPWTMPTPPKDYPAPLVDLLKSAREGETSWKLGFKASGIHKRISRIRKFVK